ncbi:DUF2939 domain-containing protein [Flammeovirga yaeyamensis]|uniref:DUF2939 domain-containing protein n=1 Tax=Flammeovirga yaeyamensis TaxID=367791 RepID=A0AAX1MYL9_9BACT|nr:DUF2939 domain-containing protein [Flammeovirga yaeyamensis]MBB3696052.1 hypothetical protein [Flammeovirga yaeyamensis]NMF34737.1 DUF2939 domain-containing protein [Flammeovirga yaeyamensis]QWG00434.1 DUF2939 domain-containing protein [Flammeovirga yaeyamensis]
MNKKIVFALLAILILGAGVGFYVYNLKDTPEVTFLEIKHAIDNKDIDSFNEYVDLDNVLNSIVDQYVNYQMNKNQGQLDIATGFMAMMKPAIVSTVKEQVEKGIKSGDINIPNTIEGVSGDVVGLLALAKGNGANYKGIKSSEVNDSQAVLTLQIQLDNTDVVNDLVVKMRKVDDHWQIYDIQKLGEILDTYLQSQQ